MKGQRHMKLINTLTIIVTIICGIYISIALTACDDSSGDNEKKTEQKNDEKENPIKQCQDFVLAIDECYFLEDWGMTTVSEEQEGCKDGTFDSHDHCLFKCNSKFVDCESFDACVNQCG